MNFSTVASTKKPALKRSIWISFRTFGIQLESLAWISSPSAPATTNPQCRAASRPHFSSMSSTSALNWQASAIAAVSPGSSGNGSGRKEVFATFKCPSSLSTLLQFRNPEMNTSTMNLGVRKLQKSSVLNASPTELRNFGLQSAHPPQALLWRPGRLQIGNSQSELGAEPEQTQRAKDAKKTSNFFPFAPLRLSTFAFSPLPSHISKNPNGIPSHSPGLLASSYPGLRYRYGHQPQRGLRRQSGIGNLAP